MSPLPSLPAPTRRLLPHHDEGELAPELVIPRLLEDGDSSDLTWLCRHLPEEALAAWLERRGGRQLSRRSRAFWELVLDRPAGPEVPSRRYLWPL